MSEFFTILRPDRRRLLMAFAATLLAGGCSRLLTDPAPQLYTLRPDIAVPPGLPKVAWQLAVAVPDAPAGLDTARIALTRSPTTMDYFAASSWTDRLPLLLQSLTMEAFENSGLIIGVDRDIAAPHADYLLELEIRDFEARYAGESDAPPAIGIRVESRLLKLPDRGIIGHLHTTEAENATRNDMDAIVIAFDRALGKALAAILTWVLTTPQPG
jgi:cholesterol transport system auxiliary component